ncbi:MAG: riboflavin biosynthesis protein RibF [Anaerosomatales bacterium]|nr:riboflavin biosynthesis protein RibF [Anaerosomatales bacterium]
MTRVVTFEPGMPPLGAAVCAIGVFDGVHLGHQALIADTVARARDTGATAAVVTFDRDPELVVSPDGAPPQLLVLADKLRYIRECGPDVVLVVPFDAHVAALAPERFLSEVLLAALVPIAAVVGHDFRFGRFASGTVETLDRYGTDHGFAVVPHELVEVDGEPVTSTRIRAAVAAGDMDLATRLLGREHIVHGRVVRGRGIGHELGVPTANLSAPPATALPASGVYAGYAEVDGVTYPAAISVGHPPSFPDANDELETHLVDFEGDLYGREVVVRFVTRLRDLRRIDDTAELARAIAADVAEVRDLLG